MLNIVIFGAPGSGKEFRNLRRIYRNKLARNTDRPSDRIRMLNPDSKSANKDKDIHSTVRICIKTDRGRNRTVKDII